MKNKKNSLVPSKNIFTALLILTILAMGVHAYLISQHYNLKLGLSAGQSLCNLSSNFNCDAVAASAYSQILSIPLALLGFLAQVVFLVLLNASHFSLSQYSENLRRILFWFSLVIAFVSIIMGLISIFQLSTYCLFCIATYLLSWVTLYLAWKFQLDSPFESLSVDLGVLLKECRWALILILAIPAAGWFGNSLILSNYGMSRLDQMIKEEIAIWQESPVYNFTDAGLVHSPVNGQNAKMVIVEFADFLCPHCKTAATTLDAFVNSTNDVKFVFKSFPLDGKCNKALTSSGDGFRCQLASSVYCAEKLNRRGWKAQEWVFKKQESLFSGADLEKFLLEFSQNLELNLDELKSCISSDETYEQIVSQAAEGAAAKIQGTPAIFVNGKKVQRGQFIPVLQAIQKQIREN